MNQTHENGQSAQAKDERKARASSLSPSAFHLSPSEQDDPGLVEALREYVTALEAEQRPNRQEFLARYPDIAEALAECLDGLEFVHAAAPQLQQSGSAAPSLSAEFPTAGPLGDYRILREVGRGGMGVVYEAEQISLGRRVALKVLPFAAALDPKQLQRFKNEAQAAAHLHHTNIVPVHAVGCERGVHFYAMQFIEGQTLAVLIAELRRQAGKEDRGSRIEDRRSRIEDRRAQVGEAGGTVEDRGPANDTKPASPLTSILYPPSSFFRTVANLGLQAAEALEHAHQLGVIHRDIKPANLLVDAGGRLWVTDFGLAHWQSQPGLTMTGDVLGTLRYMSPEQALAKRVTLDARTDVYSLGVTLYELLTLEPAYNGRDREEVLRQIAFEEPRLPSRLNKAVPAELETIVLKAMAKGPEERYPTAQELADDLRRFLEDKPIRARRPTLVQRVKKWTRRHLPVVWTAGLSLVAMLVLAVIGLAASNILITREKAQTDAAKEELERTLYYQRIALAEREWSANNLSGAEQLLDACRADLRGWEWHYLKRLRYKGLPLMEHAGAVLSVAVSPGGERIASSSQDGIIKIWDAKTGRELRSIHAHDSHARCVAFSPDGQSLASASWDKTVKVWDAQTGRERYPPLTGHELEVQSVAFSPDGKFLASTGGNSRVGGELKLWNAVTGEEVRSFRGHTGRVCCVAFSPDGQRLASGAAEGDQTVKVWDVQTGQELLTFRDHQHVVWGLAFSPDGRMLASCAARPLSSAGELKVWDARTGRVIHDLHQHTQGACAAFSPDGRRLASGSFDQTVTIWDVASGQQALTLRGHTGEVRSVVFSPDGERLYSCAFDGTVRVWDATPLGNQEEENCLTLRGHSDEVTSVAFHPQNPAVVASASIDGTVKLWNTRTALPLLNLRDPDGSGFSLAFSPDGHLVATVGGGIKIWDTNSGKLINTLDGQLVGHPLSVTFLPGGRRIASAGWEWVVHVCDLKSGEPIHRLKGHNWAVCGLAGSPDGRHVASASVDGTVRLWDVDSGKEVAGPPLQKRARPWGCVAFSGDGRQLATICMDGSINVWDTSTWKLLHSLPDRTGMPRTVVFSPDGRCLAWGGTDATIKVWHAANGEPQVLRGHSNCVRCVAFSPDGKQIASASADGTVKIWNVPSQGKSIDRIEK